MERVWKEMIKAYFEILSQQLAGQTEENHDKPERLPVIKPISESGATRIK
jgi:hypothetical protein